MAVYIVRLVPVAMGAAVTMSILLRRAVVLGGGDFFFRSGKEKHPPG